MTGDEKKLLAALGSVVTLVLAGFGITASWPLWVWLGLTVAVITVPLLVITMLRRRDQRQLLRETYEEPIAPRPEPVRYTQHVVSRLSLPSAETDYRFLMSATVCWRPSNDHRAITHPNPEHLATTAVVQRASRVTASEQPNEYDLVQHDLNAALGTPLPDETGQVDAWASEITLSLREEDAARLSKLATLRKNTELWQHERDHERDKRTYLGDDVLKSAGSAVVWWLSRDAEQIEETVRLIGTLAELSAAANNREVDNIFRRLVPGLTEVPTRSTLFDEGAAYPNLFAVDSQASEPAQEDAAHNDIKPDDTVTMDHVARVIDGLFEQSDDAERVMFSDQLARLISAHGGTDLAEQIRTRYRAPDVTSAHDEPATTTENEPGPAEGDGQLPHPFDLPFNGDVKPPAEH